MTEPIEPDRVEGAPHPRETMRLIGQEAAEASFLSAYSADRLHHAWLLTGPRGVGKATLAWRIARFLLAEPENDGLFGSPPPPETLDVAPDHPVARHVVALSEPRLKLIRRAWDEKKNALKTQITVEEARELKSFFQLSAVDGGRRVVIIDATDEMNISAANAVLKILEEPPPDTTLLLVSHQPSRLLPTIRSRCRTLRLAPLSATEMTEAMAQAGISAETTASTQLAELAGGSVGEAIRLTNLDGLDLYAKLISLFRPRLDRPAAIKLAESMTGRANEPRYDLFLRLIDLFLTRVARTALHGLPQAGAPGEAELLAQLSSNPQASRPWAELHDVLGGRTRHGKAVNLDPAALLLDTLLKIDQTAAQIAAQ